MNMVPRLLSTAGIGLALLALTACGNTATPAIPTAPSSVQVTPGPGYMQVTWEHDGQHVSSFVIMRSSLDAHGLQPMATTTFSVSGEERSYIDGTAPVGEALAYEVQAVGADGSSDPAEPATAPAPVEEEIALLGGPFRNMDGFWTSFIVYFSVAEANLPTTDVTVTITGPAGWRDAPLVTTVTPEQVASRWASATSFTAPVAGTYTVETTLSGMSPANYVLTESAAATAFPFATDLTVTENTSTAFTGTWTGPAGAESYFSFITSGTDTDAFEGLHTTETSYALTGLDLVPGALYHFSVISYPSDQTGVPAWVEPYALSITGVDFSPPLATSDCSDPASAVTLPDAALEGAILAALPEPAPSTLTCGDMLSLTELDARESGIQNLEGLQHATNLATLRLVANDIPSVLPLAELDSLEILDLTGNNISDIGPLAGLTGLQQLYVSENPLSSIDAIANLNGLLGFGAARTQITDIDVLTGKTTLLYVWLNGADHIADFGPIDTLTSLQSLLVGDTQFSNADLAMIGDNTTITRLQIWGNPQITDLSPLAGLNLTRELDIGGVGTTDFSHFVHMTDLQLLGLASLGLTNTDLGFLTNFTSLQFLGLGWNDLTDLTAVVDLVDAGILTSGDQVRVENNFLDLEDPTVAAQIQTIVDAGVTLIYEPQREPEPI